jgi:peroxiredoxin
MAAQSGGIPRAVLYLACYSAGLGIPFLLASLFFGVFVKTSDKLKRRLPLIRKISGALLVLIGVLMVTGHYQALNALAAKWQSKNTAARELRAGVNGANKAEPSDKTSALSPRAVSAKIISALSDAGLPVVREGVETIDFTLPLLDGNTQTLSALTGRVVFLNFWATWCGPCREEMPAMEAVYQRLKDRGLTILAVNLGEKPEAVSAFMRENSLTFAAALDQSGRTGMQYGAQAIPITYIIDKRGLIVSRVVGSINWNQEKIITAFEALLAE